MSRANPPDLDAGVADLRRDLEATFVDHGVDAALGQLPPAAPAPSDRAKIVVVGEVGAGKTSLINTLLERPDLLPIRPTTSYVAVGAGHPEAVRIRLTDGTVVTDEPKALRRWLDENTDAAVQHIEMLLNDPRLAGITLFDTPGVGGLDDAAAAMTLAALEQATALVFVCSADAKISIAERDFLVQAARRIDHVVFIASKVELLADLGAQNLRENEETVRCDPRFPRNRFADLAFLPFSAALAAKARGSDQKLAHSGLTTVRQHLERIAASHAVYTQLNTLRAMKEAISRAYQDLDRRKKAVENPTTRADLDRVTERLAELRDSGKSWRLKLTRELEEARDAVQSQHKRRIKALRTDYQQRLASRDRPRIDAAETDLVDDLCTLQADADTDVRTHITEVARRLLLGIPNTEESIAELAAHLPPPEETPSNYLSKRPESAKDPALVDVQTAWMGTMMGSNLINAITLGAVGPAGPIIGLPIGVAWNMLQKRMRRRVTDLAGLASWTTMAISEANLEIAGDIDRGFRKASWLLQDAVEQALTDAIKALEAAKSRHAAAAKSHDNEIRHLNKLGEELSPLTRQWHQLHNGLLALMAAPSSRHADGTAIEATPAPDTMPQ
jgi:signal recognition particle receptor subunit beta